MIDNSEYMGKVYINLENYLNVTLISVDMGKNYTSKIGSIRMQNQEILVSDTVEFRHSD